MFLDMLLTPRARPPAQVLGPRPTRKALRLANSRSVVGCAALAPGAVDFCSGAVDGLEAGWTGWGRAVGAVLVPGGGGASGQGGKQRWVWRWSWRGAARGRRARQTGGCGSPGWRSTPGSFEAGGAGSGAVGAVPGGAGREQKAGATRGSLFR